ncbi:MAG: hypothetical protein L0Y56_11635 [Nitrospira sp.]|nr:hypothetical protein [Nitrospira sp.]
MSSRNKIWFLLGIALLAIMAGMSSVTLFVVGPVVIICIALVLWILMGAEKEGD